MRRTWNEGSSGYQGGSWLPFNWYSIPVTRTLLFATVGVFLLFFFTGQEQGPVWEWIPFRSADPAWYSRPWTWFTYPFMELPSFWILLTLYVLYSMGGMLERSWGSLNFAVLFFAFTGIGALAFLVPMYLLGKPVLLFGLALPLTALVTAWAALDPELELNYWGVPIKAKLLAAIWVGMNYFGFGLQYRDPILALFALAPPAAAWFYVRKMRRLNLSGPMRSPYLGPDLSDNPPRRTRRPREEEPERVKGFNPLRRRQEQQEMERLRKLLGDDDDRPMRRN